MEPLTPEQMRLLERAKNDFLYHAPPPEVLAEMQATREAFLVLAETIIRTTPAGRDQSLALTNLEIALRFTISAAAKQHPLKDLRLRD